MYNIGFAIRKCVFEACVNSKNLYQRAMPNYLILTFADHRYVLLCQRIAKTLIRLRIADAQSDQGFRYPHYAPKAHFRVAGINIEYKISGRAP